MADIQFVDILNFCDSPHVTIRQTVAEVQLQSLSGREQSGFAEPVELNFRFLGSSRVRIRAGVNFDGRNSQFFGFFNLRQIRIDEQADQNTGSVELVDALSDSQKMSLHVQPALGCDFLAPFGHQRGLIGKSAQSDAHDLITNGHFQIQANADNLTEQPDVAVLNMSAVFSQMDGNRVGSAHLGQHRGMNRIGLRRTSRLTNGRDMVYIDSQQWHGVTAPV